MGEYPNAMMMPNAQAHRLIVIAVIMLFCQSWAQAQRDGDSYGSSFYAAGGYGLPATIRAEGGYVFGEYASVALLVTGPLSVKDAFVFSIGAAGRAFLPLRTSALSPFITASYTDSSPLALLSGVDSRDELGAEVGTLYTIDRGIHLRCQAGASTVNSGPWKFCWSLQIEFSLSHLKSN